MRTKVFDKTDIYLKSAFRKIWRWSKARRECLKAEKCILCGAKEKLYADHLYPVIDPSKGFVGWDAYYTRMFKGKLQPLCYKCHKDKTNRERKARKERK